MNRLLRFLFILGIAGQGLAAPLRERVPSTFSLSPPPSRLPFHSTGPHSPEVWTPGESEEYRGEPPPPYVRIPLKVIYISCHGWLIRISANGRVRMGEFGPDNPYMAWTRSGVVDQKQIELALLADWAHPPPAESNRPYFEASISMLTDEGIYPKGGSNMAIWNDLVAKVVPALDCKDIPEMKELLKQHPPEMPLPAEPQIPPEQVLATPPSSRPDGPGDSHPTRRKSQGVEIPGESDDYFSNLPPYDVRGPWKIVEICSGRWLMRISPDGSVRMSEFGPANPHMAWARSGVVSQKQVELALLAERAHPPSGESTQRGYAASISMSDDEWASMIGGRNIAIWNDLVAKVVPALEGRELPLIKELLKQYPPEAPVSPVPQATPEQVLASPPPLRPGQHGASDSLTFPRVLWEPRIPGQSDDDLTDLPPPYVRRPWKIIDIHHGLWSISIAPDGSVRMSQFGPDNPHMAWGRSGVVSQKQIELALLADWVHPPPPENTLPSYSASISMSDDEAKYSKGGTNIAIWNDLVAKVVPALEGSDLPRMKELLKQHPPEAPLHPKPQASPEQDLPDPETPGLSKENLSDPPPEDLLRSRKIIDIYCNWWHIRISPDGSVRMIEHGPANPYLAWTRSGVVSQKQIELALLADWVRPLPEPGTRPSYSASISMSDDVATCPKVGTNMAIWNNLVMKVIPALEGSEVHYVRELLTRFPPMAWPRPEPEAPPEQVLAGLPPAYLRRPWKVISISYNRWSIRIEPDGTLRMGGEGPADSHIAWVRSGVVSQKQIELALLAEWARAPREADIRPSCAAAISISDDEVIRLKGVTHMAIWNDLVAKVVPALEGRELPLIKELLKQFPPEAPLPPVPQTAPAK